MPHCVRVAFETLGCKLNQAETELMARQFGMAGCEVVAPDEKADIYVLNSCTVTHIADRKSRHFLRLAHRLNPEALIIATGCYAQRAKDELSAIGGIDRVVDNAEKLDLVAVLEKSGRIAASIPGPGGSHRLRTRSFIKAQDGCNRSCAYCIVPLVRGREKSLPVDEVLAEIKARVAEGNKEMVLTGTEIGGYNFQGLNLPGLLERILAETTVGRLRISSLQPQELSTGLASLWHDPRLCPHFHLALQSGSDGVLIRMQRRYTTADYERAVRLIRSVVPEAALTTDVMVGFPGETQAEFEESMSFCRRIRFARIHVFVYSARAGTTAAAMNGQIDARTKRERSQDMLALARESARAFYSHFLGRTMKVLWEQKSTGGVWSGYTGNYIRVYARSEPDLTNEVVAARLTRLYKDGVWGEPGSLRPSPSGSQEGHSGR